MPAWPTTTCSYVKFLVDRDGVPRKRFSPAFDPLGFESGEAATGLLCLYPSPPLPCLWCCLWWHIM